MRSLAVLLTTLALAACCNGSGIRGESPPVALEQENSADPALQFLLTSAATDFLTHHPSDPGSFRDVRLGHVMMPGGEAQFMLCGQYLAAQAAGEAKWMYFSTIKTSGYEQLIGSQPVGLCQGSSIIWATRGDLSSALQSRLDSLR